MGSARLCPACGRYLPPGARFCDGCGAPASAGFDFAEYKQVTVMQRGTAVLQRYGGTVVSSRTRPCRPKPGFR